MMKPLVIVCVDDEPIVLNSLKSELYRTFDATCQVEGAESGNEALSLVDEILESGHEFPVIIADYLMPGMKGDELLQKVHERSSKTLTIMLTGQADVPAVANAINRANLYRYIAKPWESHDLALTVEGAVKTYLQERELEQVNAAYRRFVPLEFLQYLKKKSITEVKLGDYVSKEMAIMFSDIRSFIALSEFMTPQENFDFVNAYFRRISPVIREHHGIIVKYLGDGMMAVFPNGVDDAVRAGIEKLRRVTAYNDQRRLEGRQSITVGIGVHVGPMMVGIIGETNRMQGDAFSDHVNQTSRLEGLTKFYGVSLIITEDVVFHLTHPEQYHLRFLDKVQVKGKAKAIAIYELYDGDPEPLRALKMQTNADFEEGQRQYFAKAFDNARACFQQVLTMNSHDHVAELYLKRSEQYLVEGVPDGWQGIERRGSK